MSEKQKEPGKKKGTPGRKKFVPTDEEGSVRCCIWRLFAVCGGQGGSPISRWGTGWVLPEPGGLGVTSGALSIFLFGEN